MNLQLIFKLHDPATGMLVFDEQQVIIKLNDQAAAHLRSLKAQGDAIDNAMGVTQRMLDEARLDYATAIGAVKPFFDTAGVAVAKFTLIEAIKAFADAE